MIPGWMVSTPAGFRGGSKFIGVFYGSPGVCSREQVGLGAGIFMFFLCPYCILCFL